jgi:hypothetical protein
VSANIGGERFFSTKTALIWSAEPVSSSGNGQRAIDF